MVDGHLYGAVLLMEEKPILRLILGIMLYPPQYCNISKLSLRFAIWKNLHFPLDRKISKRLTGTFAFGDNIAFRELL